MQTELGSSDPYQRNCINKLLSKCTVLPSDLLKNVTLSVSRIVSLPNGILVMQNENDFLAPAASLSSESIHSQVTVDADIVAPNPSSLKKTSKRSKSYLFLVFKKNNNLTKLS